VERREKMANKETAVKLEIFLKAFFREYEMLLSESEEVKSLLNGDNFVGITWPRNK
jgi:hypothetical protein